MRRRIAIDDVIDQAPVGLYQVWIVVLCLIVELLDGFDLSAASFTAPSIARDWHVASASFGPVFGIAFFGMMLGGFACGTLADRIGRRQLIVWATIEFSVMSLATAWAYSLDMLLLLRFLTGLGLGGALPNVAAISAEIMPRRLRATAVSLMYCGIPLGALSGGLVSATLVPAYGWPSVYLVGGVVPLLVAALAAAALPESLRFLAMRKLRPDRIARALNRITRTDSYAADYDYVSPDRPVAGVPVSHLFRDGRALPTLFTWLIYISTLLSIHFLSSWTPTILRNAGMPLPAALRAAALLSGGGILVTIVTSVLLDRVGLYRTIGIAFGLSATALIAAALAGENLQLLLIALSFAQPLASGIATCVSALAPTLYPTPIRSTGIGWANGVGRIGSIAGPTLGGFVLALTFSGINVVYVFVAIVTVVAAAALAALAATPMGRAADMRSLRPAAAGEAEAPSA